jgi:hypothetical protein
MSIIVPHFPVPVDTHLDDQLTVLYPRVAAENPAMAYFFTAFLPFSPAGLKLPAALSLLPSAAQRPILVGLSRASVR